MRHRTLSHCIAAGAAVALLAAALPAAAEVYTIRLTSGGTFESRYQPVQAAWDPNMVTFLDETGLAIAYVMNRMGMNLADDPRKMAVIDGAYRSIGRG